MVTPTTLEPQSSDLLPVNSAIPDELVVRQLAQQTRDRGHIILRVMGGSMGPWFVPGDILVVRRGDPGKLTSGQVIVFSRGERLIVHRIIGKLPLGTSGERIWKTKGDSSDHGDAPVHAQELVGVVCSIERAGGPVSLESRRQVVLGWLLAQISPLSRFVYPGARKCKQWSAMLTGRSRR